MRLLTVLCVAALVVAFAVPASAETQNIKVSGDIKAAYVFQGNMDYVDDGDNMNFFIQQIGVNVEADLTDNVSTYIRLINEREWDAADQAGTIGTPTSNKSFDILLDEAYVTLKEMLYAPLTVKIGRQNIWLGKGLVVGNSGNWSAGQLTTTVQEQSDMTAFDAVRATLDYDPWTVDLIYSKMDANTNGTAAFVNNRDDLDMYIANVGYDFTKYDAEAEAYYIYVHDRTSTSRTANGKTSNVQTLGLRGSLVPYDNMNIWAEGAYQFGHERTSALNRKREAGAANVGADYTFADVKWTPKLGGEWIWLSGGKSDDATKQYGWNPLYRGKYDNYIADFRNISKLVAAQTVNQANDNGLTNQQSFAIFGSIAPLTDITVDARWTALWLDRSLIETSTTTDDKDLGYELDGKVTYDYTEDVQFSVCGGFLWPGDHYKANNDKTASQVIAGVSVDF